MQIGGVNVKPLDGGDEINFVELGRTLQVEARALQQLGAKEFWATLPIMELERVVDS